MKAILLYGAAVLLGVLWWLRRSANRRKRAH
jgi:hypothetical protein